MIRAEHISRRVFLTGPLAVAAMPNCRQNKLMAAWNALVGAQRPTVETVLTRLRMPGDESVRVMDWIPFIDDPAHRASRELWRMVAGGSVDIEPCFWRLAAALASGGVDLAHVVLDHIASRKEMLDPNSLDGIGFHSLHLLDLIALACIGRAAKGDADVLKQFQSVSHARINDSRPTFRIGEIIVDRVQRKFERLQRASHAYARVVESHLAQSACDDLSQLGLPELTADQDEQDKWAWNRGLMLLYALGPCGWLGDGALRQIVSHTLDPKEHVWSGNYGVYVLAQLGRRGHRYLQDLDATAAAMAQGNEVGAHQADFVLLHALASTAADREDGPRLLQQACLLSQREEVDLTTADMRCGVTAPGIMNDVLATQLAHELVTAPLLWPAFSAFVMLFPSGRYASAACEPLIAYLRSKEGDASRRRMAAMAVLAAVDTERLARIESQIEMETDPEIATVLRNAVTYAETLDPTLLPAIDFDPATKTFELDFGSR
jgi:hypothetical protein